MHIQTNSADSSESRETKTSRGKRSQDHAAKRIQNRHAEYDWLGNPIIQKTTEQPITASALHGGTRLDAWLVSNGHATSRERAKEMIAAGLVTVRGVSKVKASTIVTDTTKVIVQATDAE